MSFEMQLKQLILECANEQPMFTEAKVHEFFDFAEILFSHLGLEKQVLKAYRNAKLQAIKLHEVIHDFDGQRNHIARTDPTFNYVGWAAAVLDDFSGVEVEAGLFPEAGDFLKVSK